ncbi:unnamed protein product, partial [Pelagomonas calceolata]
LRASHKSPPQRPNIQPHIEKRVSTASSQSSRSLQRLSALETPAWSAHKPNLAKSAFSQCFRVPPPPRGPARLAAGLIGLEPRFDRYAAPLDVVHTFIWPALCVGKKHRPLTRYRGQTARPPSIERQPLFTQTRL